MIDYVKEYFQARHGSTLPIHKLKRHGLLAVGVLQTFGVT